MNGIKKFFECLLPTSICNLKCEYCYIIQENRRNLKLEDIEYDVSKLKVALSKNRLGGVCYFSLCGGGETFLQPKLAEIANVLLSEGHYVNVTTNGTITAKIDEFLKINKNYISRVNFSFSLHYIELLNRNLLNEFFNNVKKVRDNGASFIVQINLYDGYLPYLEEIKKICLENVGAYPQVAATRLEESGNVRENVKLHTNLSRDDYTKLGNSFESKLFEFTMKNFNVKRKEFCYAGDWSYTLNLKTGDYRACYCNGRVYNIFNEIDKPLKIDTVGYSCNSLYCVNSSHFLSLGVIPSVKCPTYYELRNREQEGWVTESFREATDNKLINNNCEYCKLRKMKLMIKHKLKKIKRILKRR